VRPAIALPEEKRNGSLREWAHIRESAHKRRSVKLLFDERKSTDKTALVEKFTLR